MHVAERQQAGAAGDIVWSVGCMSDLGMVLVYLQDDPMYGTMRAVFARHVSALCMPSESRTGARSTHPCIHSL